MPSIGDIKVWVSGLLALVALLFSATGSQADWRKDLGTFRVGMIESTARQLSPSNLARVREAFAKTLAMPVEIIQMRDFPALIDAQASSRIEYAIYSAAAYSTAWLSCECIMPIVAPLGANGSTGTKTVLFLKTVVSLANVATSKGIAISGKDSLTTFGVPLSQFTVANRKITGNEAWLKFYNDGDAAIAALNSGEVDGLFASISANQALKQALNPGDALQSALLANGLDLTPVWQSNIITFGPHAIRKNLNPEIKLLLTNFLVDLATSDPDLFDLMAGQHAARFAPVSQDAYSPTIQAVRALAEVSKQQKP